MDKISWKLENSELISSIKLRTNGGYSFEQIMNNKNCSKDPKYWVNLEGSEKYLFQSSVAESWEFFDKDILNPIRNTNQIYIKFLDHSVFVNPSNYFKEYKSFTLYPEGTLAYDKFWDDLELKVTSGFEVDGVRITGRHFFTINFGQFLAIPTDKFGNAISKRKRHTFLRLIDFQYYIFMELEECFLEGPYVSNKSYFEYFPLKTQYDYEELVLKSFETVKGRRKGWTAMVGTGVLNYNFTFIESSSNVLAAYEKSHYDPMLKAFHNTKSFTDKNTPWVRVTDILGKRDQLISGISYKDDKGITVTQGYKSELNTVSFMNNPFKGIGESASIINIEEPGKFDSLLESYPVSFEPLIREGETIIGNIVMGGTAGDISGGGSLGLEEMINKPGAYGFKGYPNIYEEITKEDDLVGWFIDDLWFSPKHISKAKILELDSSNKTKELLDKFEGDFIDTVDIHGNSYRYFSDLVLDAKRKTNRKTSTEVYQKFITQQPKYLSEAFLSNENSPFDVATAKEALGDLTANIDKVISRTGSFRIDSEGNTLFTQEANCNIINEFPWKDSNTEGNWVLFQTPLDLDSDGVKGRYLAGTDPVDWGTEEKNASSNNSLASTYIIDSITRNIVAVYVSRPRQSDHYFEQLWRGLDYYGATLLYENNLKGLFSYFKTKNKVYLLAGELTSLKDKHGYKNNPNIKGFHATAAINNHARELINRWTMEEVVIGQNQDSGEVITTARMFNIKDKALLQEVIKWNSKGNFDRISGLGAVMLLLFDRDYSIEDFKVDIPFFKNELFNKANKRYRPHAGNRFPRIK